MSVTDCTSNRAVEKASWNWTVGLEVRAGLYIFTKVVTMDSRIST